MKNQLILLTLMVFLPSFLSAQDPVNVWAPWDCQNGTGATYGPLPVGHRKVIMQFDTPYSEGVQYVYYSVPTANGTIWRAYGPVSAGRQMFAVEYLEEGIWPPSNMFSTALAFVDGEGVSTVTTPLWCTVENAPSLTLSVNSTEIAVEVLGSWGIVSSCEEFTNVVTIEAEDPYNEVIWSQQIPYHNEGMIVQIPEAFPSDVCLTATLKRLHTSGDPEFTYIVTTSNVYCTELTTGIASTSNSSVVEPFPNPFDSHLTFFAEGKWMIFDVSGKLVLQGNKSIKLNTTISTEALAPGAYVIKTENSSKVIVKK